MSESCSVVSDPLQPHGLYSSWYSLGQNTGMGKPFPSPGDLPNPGIEPRSPTLQADSLPSKSQGKPMKTREELKKEKRLEEKLTYYLQTLKAKNIVGYIFVKNMKTYGKPKETIQYLQIDKKMYTNIFFSEKMKIKIKLRQNFHWANEQKKEKQV